MRYQVKPEWLMLALTLSLIVGLVSSNFELGMGVFAAVIFVFSFFGLYIPYAMDNPQRVWFKRKLYGWGWTPVTWQGWVTTLGYVGLVAFFSLTVDESSPRREVFFAFVLPTLLLTITFIRIAMLKGEKPKWQWGRK